MSLMDKIMRLFYFFVLVWGLMPMKYVTDLKMPML